MKALQCCQQNPVGRFGWSLKREKAKRNADGGSLTLELPEGSKDPTGNRVRDHLCSILAGNRCSAHTWEVWRFEHSITSRLPHGSCSLTLDLHCRKDGKQRVTG